MKYECETSERDRWTRRSMWSSWLLFFFYEGENGNQLPRASSTALNQQALPLCALELSP